MRHIPLILVLAIVCLPFFLLWLVSSAAINLMAMFLRRAT